MVFDLSGIESLIAQASPHQVRLGILGLNFFHLLLDGVIILTGEQFTRGEITGEDDGGTTEDLLEGFVWRFSGNYWGHTWRGSSGISCGSASDFGKVCVVVMVGEK